MNDSSQGPPVRSRSLLRLILMIALLAITAGLLAIRLSSGTGDRPLFPPDDFVEYWAAGHLNAAGENPYSPGLLLPLQRYAGRDTDEAIMMWNPPWTLPVVMPFGRLGPKLSHLAWVVMGFALILLSADRAWLLAGGPISKRWIAWFVSLTFIPSMFVLQSGQIGTILLLGVVGVMQGFAAKKPWIIGVAAFLLAIKPHLVYLAWPAFAIWMATERSRLAWLSGAWFVGAVLTATLIAMAVNPDVLGQYLEAMRDRTPDQWKSPTIGSWLRELFGPEKFWLQFVPMTCGGLWFLIWIIGKRKAGFDWPDDFYPLLLASFVTASYGAWPFDVVILLPVVISLFASLPRLAPHVRILFIAGYGIWTGLAVALNQLKYNSEFFFWMAPTLLIFWILGRRGKGVSG